MGLVQQGRRSFWAKMAQYRSSASAKADSRGAANLGNSSEQSQSSYVLAIERAAFLHALPANALQQPPHRFLHNIFYNITLLALPGRHMGTTYKISYKSTKFNIKSFQINITTYITYFFLSIDCFCVHAAWLLFLITRDQ